MNSKIYWVSRTIIGAIIVCIVGLLITNIIGKETIDKVPQEKKLFLTPENKTIYHETLVIDSPKNYEKINADDAYLRLIFP